MKDLFSKQSDQYAKFRPTYPDALFEYLNQLPIQKNTAWDCGTGNGQIAISLASSFKEVYATDISLNQLNNAPECKNIYYSQQAAEKTNFEVNTFDLITVAQAIHWFDFDKFFQEVFRTAKPNAMIAVIGYGVLNITPEIDQIIYDFYAHRIGEYWDEERKYIDHQYQTIPFPFEERIAPKLNMCFEWTLNQFIGYLETWSAVKHYQNSNSTNPLSIIHIDLEKAWGLEQYRKVTFPLFLRVGQINK